MTWPEWKKLYQSGYFDQKGFLRLEFLRRETMDDLARQIANDGVGLSRTQARRFFQHCRRIEQRLRVGKVPWETVRGDVLKLDAAAADAINKSPAKISQKFHDFIRMNVEEISTEHDFLDGFMRHFEALIAFGQVYFGHD